MVVDSQINAHSGGDREEPEDQWVDPESNARRSRDRRDRGRWRRLLLLLRLLVRLRHLNGRQDTSRRRLGSDG